MIKYTGDIRRDFEKATAEIVRLETRLYDSDVQITSLKTTIKSLRESKKNDKEKYENIIAEKDAVIKELKNQLAHAQALLDRDGTNTGIPTSQTPINKEKVIPNSRRSSGKSKGGQLGHKKSSLEVTEDIENVEIVEHPLTAEDSCPKCGSHDFSFTGEKETKVEYDVSIKVVKRIHDFLIYKCNDCGKRFRGPISTNLKENAQYGYQLQALLLSLTNTVNASMNKAAMFLFGVTEGKLAPCEGYVAKLQTRAANNLRVFREELKKLLITRGLVYWDDTVIMIMTERACFRFYGDETISYYTAHEHKDMESLDDDNILNLLTNATKTMHDHNTVNYNEKYSFENIECNQHLQRDCQKNTDDTCHQWSDDLKKLISTTIKDRNDMISKGIDSFDDSYIEDFHKKIEDCLSKGWNENQNDPDNCGAIFERRLLNRLKKFYKNYFLWIEDFSLPTTNNLSERGLRGIKSHMKISGQFESEKAADNHALIRTYIETCRKNGINEIEALNRLCCGNPYTVKEIFHLE